MCVFTEIDGETNVDKKTKKHTHMLSYFKQSKGVISLFSQAPSFIRFSSVLYSARDQYDVTAASLQKKDIGSINGLG